MNSLWKPWGAVRADGVPTLGALVADDHVVWEVASVVDLVPRADWPGTRTHRLGMESRTGPPVVRQATTGPYSAWWTYPGRFPVCSCCGEPAPCRVQLREDTVERELARMRRFETPGQCPACGEPVRKDQPAVRFPVNLEVPLGPPVTYHVGSTRCQLAAVDYQDAWLHRYPGARELIDAWRDGAC
jgi:hypothetical protein